MRINPAYFTFLLLIAGVLFCVPVALSYPPGDWDVMNAEIDMTIQLNPTGSDRIIGDGPTVVKRGNPYDVGGLQTIDTELVALSLTGTGFSGPVTVTLSPEPTHRSMGKTTEQSPGTGFPADSFFDIFVEVKIPGLGETFINTQPMRISCVIINIPMICTPFYNIQPVALYPKSNPTGQPWGFINTSGCKLHFRQRPSLSVWPLGPSALPPERIFWAPPVLPGLNPGLTPSDNLNALSYGYNFIGYPMNLIFSVDKFSTGIPGTAVNAQATLIPAEAHGDEFIAYNLPILGGSNLLLVDEGTLGLLVCDDIDALENQPPLFVDNNGDGVPDPGKRVFFSLQTGSPTLVGPMTADDILLYLSGVISIYADGVTNIGLLPGDDVDALCLFDKGYNATLDPGTTTMPPAPFLSDLALFSLAPGSPTLMGANPKLPGGGSPADIFITAFDGNFLVFSNAANLGLLTTDNVDALKCMGKRLRCYIRGTAIGGGICRFTLFGHNIIVNTTPGKTDQETAAEIVNGINGDPDFDLLRVKATLLYGSGIIELAEGTEELAEIQSLDPGFEVGFGDPPPPSVPDWILY